MSNLLYKLNLGMAWLYTIRAYLKNKCQIANPYAHGQNGCRLPFWSPSLLLATLVITLLALAGHHLAKHHDTIAIHEGHT